MLDRIGLAAVPLLALAAVPVLAIARPAVAQVPEAHGVCELNCDGDPPDSGWIYVPPPPPDPRIEQARLAHNEGVDAWNARNWASAADAYYRAWQLNGSQSDYEDYQRAVAYIHTDRGSAAWDRKDWQRAIDEYHEALKYSQEDWIQSNYDKARAIQSSDWAVDAYNHGNYDLAVEYWKQANRFSPDPYYERQIRDALQQGANRTARTAAQQAQDALKAGRFAEAQALAEQALRQQPNSVGALDVVADATLAVALKSPGDLSATLARLDAAMAALARLKQVLPNVRSNLSYAYRNALAKLSAEATTADQRDQVVAAYARWQKMLGGDPDLARQVLAKSAGGDYLGMAVTAAGTRVPESTAVSSPATSGPPPAGAGRRASVAPTPLDRMIDRSARDALPITAASPGRPATIEVCFDGDGCTNTRPPYRFQKTLDPFFVPANQETPEMREAHAAMTDALKDLRQVENHPTGDIVSDTLQMQKITARIEEAGKTYQKAKRNNGIHVQGDGR